MAIWVFIKPFVVPDGDDAKSALPKKLKEKTVKETIEEAILERIRNALPKKFSDKEADKPAGVSKTFNAIRITGELKLKIETKGSLMKATGELKVVFEAIKTPDTQNGEYLASASKGALAERRGADERAVVGRTIEVLDSVVEEAVKKVLEDNRFIAAAKRLNLPL
jgi:hypothetical protein